MCALYVCCCVGLEIGLARFATPTQTPVACRCDDMWFVMKAFCCVLVLFAAPSYGTAVGSSCCCDAAVALHPPVRRLKCAWRAGSERTAPQVTICGAVLTADGDLPLVLCAWAFAAAAAARALCAHCCDYALCTCTQLASGNLDAGCGLALGQFCTLLLSGPSQSICGAPPVRLA